MTLPRIGPRPEPAGREALVALVAQAIEAARDRLADQLAAEALDLVRQNLEPPAYTLAQAAGRLQCSIETVTELIREGRLRYVQLGRARGRLIPRDELDRFLHDWADPRDAQPRPLPPARRRSRQHRP